MSDVADDVVPQDDDPVQEPAATPAPTEKPAPAADHVLGMDFGSTKTVVSVLRSGEKFPELVRNELANRTTPASIVFSADGQRLVGEPAELVKSRGGAICDIKSRVRSGAKPQVNFHGESVQLECAHLVGMMGARVQGDVDRFVADNNLLADGKEEPVRKIVLCTPPSMTPQEIKTMQQGLSLAGYNLLGNVWDVSCSALVFAHRLSLAAATGDKAIEAQNVCFVDIGHEFVSVQICHVNPAQSTLKVLATESRAGCGASAFSQVLVDMWVDVLASKHKIHLDKLESAKSRDRALMRLGVQAEKAKNMLSGLSEVNVTVDSVVPDLDLRTSVTRAAMEDGAKQVVQGLTELLKAVVKSASLETTDVKRVEVVGGGSRIPCVQETVKSVFGAESLFKTLDNECTASMGAALFAGILEGSVEFTVEGVYRPDAAALAEAAGLDDAALAASKALEERMHADDLAITARNDAKNKMEQWIFDTRRESNDQTVGVDDDETLDKLRSMLSTAEDWLLDEADQVSAADIEEKLASLQKDAREQAPKLFDVLQKRAEKERRERLESQQEVLAPVEKKKKTHMRPSEKIADAKAKKEHGNRLIKDNNFEDASKRYTQALGICAEMDGTLSPENQAECNDIKLSCYLNLTLCNIKIKLPKLGIYNATKAIELFPDKPKGYLRRAQARYEVKEFEEAREDLRKCKQLDPENTVAWEGLLKKTERAIQIQKDKQKKTFGKMFQ